MTTDERKEKIKICLQSGMTIKQWCKIEGIGYSTFLRWRKLYPDESAAGEAQEWVTINAASPEIKKETGLPDEPKITIRKGSWEIGIKEGASAELLMKVLKMVEASCC